MKNPYIEKVEGCCTANMGNWKAKSRLRTNRASQTPGIKKDRRRCQLSFIGSLPRKAWIKARAYKHKTYGVWLKYGNDVNHYVDSETSS